MSGPKCSKFELLEAERRRQEEKRKKRLKELEEAKRLEKKKNEFKELKTQLKAMINEVNSIYEEDIKEGRQLFDDNYYIEQIVEIKQSILSDIKLVLDKNEEVKLEQLINRCKEYSSTINKNRSLIDKLLKQIYSALKEQIEFKKLSSSELDLEFETSKCESSSRKAFDLYKYEKKNTYKENRGEQLKLFQNTIESYLNVESFKYRDEIIALKTSTESIAENIRLDETFKDEQIKLRLGAFMATKSKYDREVKYIEKISLEYEEEIAVYEILVDMLDKNAEAFLNKNKKLSLEERLSRLKEENVRLQGELRKKEEAEYISFTINEVMKGLGYNIIAEDYLNSSNCKVLNNLYEFENDSAINVFTSDNGSVMFEVTGMDNKKREPTSVEKVKLKEDMESFCTKYPVIKDKLKEKGIILTNENLMPSEEKYAKITDLSKKNVVRKFSAQRKREDNRVRAIESY